MIDRGFARIGHDEGARAGRHRVGVVEQLALEVDDFDELADAAHVVLELLNDQSVVGYAKHGNEGRPVEYPDGVVQIDVVDELERVVKRFLLRVSSLEAIV